MDTFDAGVFRRDPNRRLEVSAGGRGRVHQIAFLLDLDLSGQGIPSIWRFPEMAVWRQPESALEHHDLEIARISSPTKCPTCFPISFTPGIG